MSGCARMLRTSLTLRAHALYLTGCAGSVKTKVKRAASPAAEPGAAESPFTQPAAAGAMPVLATPCFLPKAALEAMLERGVVGGVEGFVEGFEQLRRVDFEQAALVAALERVRPVPDAHQPVQSKLQVREHFPHL